MIPCGPHRFKTEEGYFLVTSRSDMSTVLAAEEAQLICLEERELYVLMLNELMSGGDFLSKTLEGWADDCGFRPRASSYPGHGVMSYLREACSPMGYLVGWRLDELGMAPVYSIGSLPRQESGAATFRTLQEKELQVVPEAEKPAALKGKAVYRGSGEATGLVNETDAEKPKSEQRCPSVNFNSESLESADPAVEEWFKANSPKRYSDDMTSDFWNGTLGSDGGGGFVKGQTKVGQINKGDVLWRYCDPKSPIGSWWFVAPMDGDPRVFAALPEYSSGQYLVKGIAKTDIPILKGPGAPRCTNKPGGPEQVFVPYDPKASKTESKWIALC